MDLEHDDREQEESKPIHGAMLIKAMAVLFVVAIYLIIFLKILFLQ